MAILYTGEEHDTPKMADEQRDYVRISQSSLIARTGVLERNINTLAAGVALYYSVQLDEGMRPPAGYSQCPCKKNIWEAATGDTPCTFSPAGMIATRLSRTIRQ